MLKRRASGILLAVSSLPGRYGVGDLGPCARDFVDFLQETGQNVWQVLPIHPPHPRSPWSPYDCLSAFAGNPLYISPEWLHEHDLLARKDLRAMPSLPSNRVNYRRATACKTILLRKAYTTFRAADNREYGAFCKKQKYWLEDYALFVALHEAHDYQPWNRWPAPIRRRQPAALKKQRSSLSEAIAYHRFVQFIFYCQWSELRAYAKKRSVRIFGDIPIYVSYNSADVWAHPKNFQLNHRGRPVAVSGCPPDYFSRTGQLWNNPLYDWSYLRKQGYSWWTERIRHTLRLYDLVRIDHFRGLAAYWSVPAGSRTAASGRWVKAPGEDFLGTVFRLFPDAGLVAEDLGVITPDVRELMRRWNLPGMRVLQFAFGDDPAGSLHAPHRHKPNTVAYTGTHDNNTTRGWFRNELNRKQQKRMSEYCGKSISASNIHWEMIRLALASVANLAIIPMQDLLGLGIEERMNRPARLRGNWQWRMRSGRMAPAVREKLACLTQLYGRN